MPSISNDLIIYIVSFVTIWVGSGLIVSSANKIAHKLRLPAFIISFVFLGILTSTPEMAVGLTAVASGTPLIFIGNLLGGVPILFFLLVPMLAIFGGGINLNHKLGNKTLA
ncbi:MAG: Na+/Ca2+ exchange integral membrane protein, partial [Candidatus Daviesbacteria bacterium GW2011_GWC1_40_9]